MKRIVVLTLLISLILSIVSCSKEISNIDIYPSDVVPLYEDSTVISLDSDEDLIKLRYGSKDDFYRVIKYYTDFFEENDGISSLETDESSMEFVANGASGNYDFKIQIEEAFDKYKKNYETITTIYIEKNEGNYQATKTITDETTETKNVVSESYDPVHMTEIDFSNDYNFVNLKIYTNYPSCNIVVNGNIIANYKQNRGFITAQINAELFPFNSKFNLKLEFLDFKQNVVLQTIEYNNIYFTNKKCNVSSLINDTEIEYLYIQGEDLDIDLATLANHRELKVLNIDGYSADISGELSDLCGLSKLRILSIRGASNISGNLELLENLPKLESLTISSSNLTGNIDSLANLPNLRLLCIQNASNYDIYGNIESLNKLDKLEIISISDTEKIIIDLSTLAKFQSLNNIHICNDKRYFYDNEIENVTGDLSDLSSMNNLKYFYIDRCIDITGDLSSLNGLNNLRYVRIFECKLITGKVKLSTGATIEPENLR